MPVILYMEMLQTTQLGRASQVALVIKNQPANAGDIREVGLSPVSGGSTVGGHGKPTPVFFPGRSNEQRRLAGYSPKSHKE